MASMHCNVIPQRPQRGTSCLSSNHSCHDSQPAAFPARNSSRVPTSHAVSPAKRTVSFQISAASSASCRTHHLQGQYLQSFGHATGLSHEQVLSRRSLHRRGRLALTALPQDALHQSLSGESQNCISQVDLTIGFPLLSLFSIWLDGRRLKAKNFANQTVGVLIESVDQRSGIGAQVPVESDAARFRIAIRADNGQLHDHHKIIGRFLVKIV